ncbi:RNA polymerase sigma factor [Corallococcus exiguus]|uniref:RNA polymerase sigma factor n=1 Tax=Corallococcus exiguus TaxID=83462 RepID=UPI0014947543|nr:sigma factor [Corallococcus exiguus]NPD24945.1 hypothetical protein [Corallococcus exiguus]NRD46782.1 hypothetical protein [Corallococcus exiguus]
MSNPSRLEVEQLHKRMLGQDSDATHDVFEAFMEPLVDSLVGSLRCARHDANEYAADALFAYFRKPDGFDANQSSLWFFLNQIARRRAYDAYRSQTKRTLRENNPLTLIEVHLPAPNNAMEDFVSVTQRLERLSARVESGGYPARDVAGMRVILLSEGRVSEEEMASALEISHLPLAERLPLVRSHTERLRRLLRSLYKEVFNDER